MAFLTRREVDDGVRAPLRFLSKFDFFPFFRSSFERSKEELNPHSQHLEIIWISSWWINPLFRSGRGLSIISEWPSYVPLSILGDLEEIRVWWKEKRGEWGKEGGTWSVSDWLTEWRRARANGNGDWLAFCFPIPPVMLCVHTHIHIYKYVQGGIRWSTTRPRSAFYVYPPLLKIQSPDIFSLSLSSSSSSPNSRRGDSVRKSGDRTLMRRVCGNAWRGGGTPYEFAIIICVSRAKGTTEARETCMQSVTVRDVLYVAYRVLLGTRSEWCWSPRPPPPPRSRGTLRPAADLTTFPFPPLILYISSSSHILSSLPSLRLSSSSPGKLWGTPRTVEKKIVSILYPVQVVFRVIFFSIFLIPVCCFFPTKRILEGIFSFSPETHYEANTQDRVLIFGNNGERASPDRRAA